jgi:hypothetical protein
MPGIAVAALALLVLALPLAALTAWGAVQRGNDGAMAVVAGLAFPVTWVVWYVRDEQRYPRRRDVSR